MSCQLESCRECLSKTLSFIGLNDASLSPDHDRVCSHIVSIVQFFARTDQMMSNCGLAHAFGSVLVVLTLP